MSFRPQGGIPDSTGQAIPAENKLFYNTGCILSPEFALY